MLRMLSCCSDTVLNPGLLAMSTWLSYHYSMNAQIETPISQEEIRLTGMEIGLW